MAKYERIVTTGAGLELLENAAYMGGSIQFTSLKTGNGVYDGTEDLASATGLKNVCQTFGVGSITKKDGNIVVSTVLSNNGVTEGYTMTEIGLYATGPNVGEEILYAVIIATAGHEDYFTAYTDAPTSITLELVIGIAEAENVTFTVTEGGYVPAKSFEAHVNDDMVHITEEKLEEWNDNTDAIAAIINGTTPVGKAKDANTLGGKGASEFAHVNSRLTPSIEIVVGDHNYIKDTIDSTVPALPATSNYTHYVHKTASGTVKTVISIGYDYSDEVYVYSAKTGKWRELTDVADLANYLPKTGGAVNGNLSIESEEAKALTYNLKNALREGRFLVHADGRLGFYDVTNSKWIFTSALNGDTTYSGGKVNGKLTVENAQSIPFGTKCTSGDRNMTSYEGASGILGYLGFDGVGNPAYLKGGVGYFPLLHTGNVGEHALPISGGTVRNTTPAPLNIDNLNVGEILSLIGYYANGAQLGLMGFYGANNPVFYSTAGTINSLHHDGNSNKIAFTEDDTTAPAIDALWAHL